MEEERREEIQGQQEQQVLAAEEQRRGGMSAAVSFFLGLIVGAIAMFAITFATWKMPLDSANEQLKTLEAQVQMEQQRADKMRAALSRAQEALSALNEVLQELSPQTTTSPGTATQGQSSSSQQ